MSGGGGLGARDRRRGDRVAARGMAASAHGERKTR
jgi:hypothetical protein